MRTEQRRGTDAAVEAVEGGVEVEPKAEAVHLQEHLRQEQPQEHKLCIVWGGERERVQITSGPLLEILRRNGNIAMTM